MSRSVKINQKNRQTFVSNVWSEKTDMPAQALNISVVIRNAALPPAKKNVLIATLYIMTRSKRFVNSGKAKKMKKIGKKSAHGNATRLPKVTSMNFCSAAKPVLQRSRSGFTLSGKARGAVEKRQSGGQKGATGLLATASNASVSRMNADAPTGPCRNLRRKKDLKDAKDRKDMGQGAACPAVWQFYARQAAPADKILSVVSVL